MAYEVYRDEKGEWRWLFVAINGNITARSEVGYKTKQECEEMVDNMKAVRKKKISSEKQVNEGFWRRLLKKFKR